MSTGVAKQLELNKHGQVTASVVDPGGLSLRSAYEYDPAGRLRRYVDPMTMATRWDRDALGRPTVVSLPDGTAWKYFADTKNRTTREQTPSGNVVEYALVDAGGRLVHMTAAPGPGQHGLGEPAQTVERIVERRHALARRRATWGIVQPRRCSSRTTLRGRCGKAVGCKR